MSGINWLVCVESSASSIDAFNYCIYYANKERDHIYLLHADESTPQLRELIVTSDKVLEEILDSDAQKVLIEFGQRAQKAGVKHTLLCGRDSNPGALACLAIQKHYISHVVVGSSTKSTIKKMLVGSTSRYLLDNADAIVIVVKKKFRPVPHSEEHASKQQVIEAEEQERSSRMKGGKQESKQPGDQSKKIGDQSKQTGEQSKQTGEQSKQTGEQSKQTGDQSKQTGDQSKQTGEQSKQTYDQSEIAKKLEEHSKHTGDQYKQPEWPKPSEDPQLREPSGIPIYPKKSERNPNQTEFPKQTWNRQPAWQTGEQSKQTGDQSKVPVPDISNKTGDPLTWDGSNQKEKLAQSEQTGDQILNWDNGDGITRSEQSETQTGEQSKKSKKFQGVDQSKQLKQTGEKFKQTNVSK